MDRIDIFKAFFTQDSKYYSGKLEKFEHGEKYSFNFWAGFFGLTWFIYRKMNIQAVVIFFILFVLTLISAVIFQLLNPYDKSNGLYTMLIIWVLSFVILGFIGNNLYLKKSIQAVNNFINENGLENIDNSMINKIRKIGGTSMMNALIIVGVMILIQIIIKIIK